MTDRLQPLVSCTDLTREYRTPSSRLFSRAEVTSALSGVTLSVERGESVAIVGESGSGKSTLLKLLLGLDRPTSGTVRYDGREVDPKRDRLLWLRRRTGLVFQDPYSSFDPRCTIGESVGEPLVATGVPGDRAERIAEILDRMELPADAADRYPAEFSGGQRQRIAIARALVHGPELLVGDEPVSALDVLVRGRILALLGELRREFGLTMITVTHDLGIVPTIADRVVVMHRGRIVEDGPVDRVLENPADPYTRRLISSVPRLPDDAWEGDGPTGTRSTLQG